MTYNFNDLKGRNCVITGGFGVIGLALCKGLAAAGVNLAVISRRAAESPLAEEISKEFKVKCIGINAGVTDKAALEKALERVHQELGQVDILVNCAGGNAPGATCKVEQLEDVADLADSFYGLDLAEEYQNLRNAVAQMDALSGEETRNASVDPETVTLVQTLLNGAGFLCGAPDGIAGRQTASCIERFQLMYGYEPADGIIDDELISQLQSRQ